MQGQLCVLLMVQSDGESIVQVCFAHTQPARGVSLSGCAAVSHAPLDCSACPAVAVLLTASVGFVHEPRLCPDPRAQDKTQGQGMVFPCAWNEKNCEQPRASGSYYFPPSLPKTSGIWAKPGKLPLYFPPPEQFHPFKPEDSVEDRGFTSGLLCQNYSLPCCWRSTAGGPRPACSPCLQRGPEPCTLVFPQVLLGWGSTFPSCCLPSGQLHSLGWGLHPSPVLQQPQGLIKARTGN